MSYLRIAAAAVAVLATFATTAQAQDAGKRGNAASQYEMNAPFSREALETLDQETADEIDKALDAHIGGAEGESQTTSANGSGPVSSSASGSGGPGTPGSLFPIT